MSFYTVTRVLCHRCGHYEDTPTHHQICGGARPQALRVRRVVVNGLVYDEDKVPQAVAAAVTPNAAPVHAEQARMEPEVSPVPLAPDTAAAELALARLAASSSVPEAEPALPRVPNLLLLSRTCPVCGQLCKTPAGRAAHIRFQHKE